MAEKRSRSANFTGEECNIMVNLIKEYEKIIECKKTDSITTKEKDNCWEKITDAFNSKSGERRRSSKELKLKYENIKRNLKRKIAANKLETTRTGGGIPKIKVLTSSEEIIYSMIRLAVDGLPGRFDEDEEYEPIDIEEAEFIYEGDKLFEETPTDTETTSYNWSKWTPVALRKPLSKVLEVKELLANPIDNSNDSQDQEINIKGNNSSENNNLNKEFEKKNCVSTNKISDKGNKGPERKSINKSKTLKRYPQLPEQKNTNALMEAKLELIKLQCKHYNKLLEEIDQKITKRDLKIQILKVDLEIKSLELMKQKTNN